MIVIGDGVEATVSTQSSDGGIVDAIVVLEDVEDVVHVVSPPGPALLFSLSQMATRQMNDLSLTHLI